MCKYILNITILGPKAKLLTPLSTVAVRKHTRFKRQRVFSEGVTTDAHTKLLLCPKGPRVYVCTNSCAQTCTHACTHSQDRGTLDSEGGCWSKQTEKKKSRTFRHTTNHGWKKRTERKESLDLPSLLAHLTLTSVYHAPLGHGGPLKQGTQC